MPNFKKLIKPGLVMASVTVLLLVAACSSNTSGVNSAPSGRIRPTLVTATPQGSNALSIPASQVQQAWNTRFAVNTPNGREIFMAYVYKGQTYVRASVCPPCQSQSFSLVGNTLVCDSCGTVFYAESGLGKSGPCVRYPKQQVTAQVVDGDIVMQNADLLSAYQRTLSGQ